MLASESQRMAYLKVMGIQAYFPRRPLSGARPVDHYADDFLSPSLPSDSAPSVAPASAQELLSMLAVKPANERATHNQPALPQPPAELAPQQTVDLPPVQQIPTPTPPETAQPPAPELSPNDSEPSQDDEEIRFVFAYFPINEHFAVINELPWSKAASVSPSCRKLLADILKALGVDVPERNLNPMVFTWPLFEGAPTDLNSENARQTLEGFVSKRLRLLPVKMLLVLAEQSAQLLFPRDFLASQGATIKHPRHELDVVLTHSLNAMEAVPDLKRAVWNTLQPLRGKLNGESADSHDGVS